jgi:Cu-processing system permease protein
MNKVIKYVLYDILQNRILVAYTAFLLLISLSLFGLEENPSKAMMSLLNIVLIVVPLISMVFSTIHFYNSYEFIELLLAQPLSRTRVLLSEYVGVSVSLLLALLVGMGVPIMVFAMNDTGWALLISGMALTLVFVSLAFLATVLTRDKAKGIGVALLLWFYFALIYDGLVLFILFSFSDYPLEKAVMILTSLNPVDLGRVIILLKMDISALMGVTGALYKDFFGSNFGMIYSISIMFLWIIIPLWVAVRIFKRKDL